MPGEAAVELEETNDEISSENEEVNLDNPLDVSDEDFAELSLSDLEELSTKSESEEDPDDDKDDEETKNEQTTKINEEDNHDGESGNDDGSDGKSGSESGESSGSSDDGADGDGKPESGSGNDSGSGESESTEAEAKSGDSKGEGESVSDGEEESSDAELNFQKEYEKLLAPFKANGRDMTIENVDDARTLMQMGANYNKKMAGLKPNLKLIKMLDNNGLLDEQKLSFLIDLDKKDPEAIKKLMKDSGIDPTEVDLESENNYESKSYTVDDKEVELDVVLDDIKDTPSFNETINIISNKWDESSKQVLVENPDAIKVINEQVGNGIYGKIMDVVDQQRMLGKLVGVSDVEAYKQVGDAINAAGGFKPDDSNNVNTQTTTTQQKTKTVDPKLRDRKKAASSTKATKTKSKDSQYNPLSMSDEAIEKLGDSKFM